MRLKVTLENTRETALPFHYPEHLTAAVYVLLGASDAEYARFLHDEGYGADDGPKRFRLFTFSGLRVARHRRKVVNGSLHLAPGPVDWLISSPVALFVQHLATGLLSAGSLRVGAVTFPVSAVEAVCAPDFAETAHFTCLTPIVAAMPLPGGGTHYLRPQEGEEFSHAIGRNLCRKYQVLHGQAPVDGEFELTFDPLYLERADGGTKLIWFKGIGVVGALAPFTATASPELLRLLWECGGGEKNSSGFGMVEALYNAYCSLYRPVRIHQALDGSSGFDDVQPDFSHAFND